MIENDDWYFPRWSFDKVFKKINVEDILDCQIKNWYNSRVQFDEVNQMVQTAMWCLQDGLEMRPSNTASSPSTSTSTSSPLIVLRNVPVGGGCRKTKRSKTKKIHLRHRRYHLRRQKEASQHPRAPATTTTSRHHRINSAGPVAAERKRVELMLQHVVGKVPDNMRSK
ncbi:hypothetical protein COP1_022475 [Malus domestica]